MNEIHDNYELVMNKVKAAAAKSGRDYREITVIGVTKTVGVEDIKSFLALGNKNIGENRVQELLSKHAEIGDGACWHLIGHLQTNKVKSVIDKVSLIHSVDSLRLAAEINRRSIETDRRTDILIEINISGEDSKFGVAPSECRDFIAELLKFDGITVKGLMTVAPFVENPDENRIYFKKMHNLLVDIQKYFLNNVRMVYLSMGMTNDFEVAVEEGSNMLRIGTGIFGKRLS